MTPAGTRFFQVTDLSAHDALRALKRVSSGTLAKGAARLLNFAAVRSRLGAVVVGPFAHAPGDSVPP